MKNYNKKKFTPFQINLIKKKTNKKIINFKNVTNK